MSVGATREKLRAAETLLQRADNRLKKAEAHAESAARDAILGSSAGAIISVLALCASVANYDTLTNLFDANAGFFIDVFAFLGIIFFLSSIGSGFEERRRAGAKARGLRTEVDRRTCDADVLRDKLEGEEIDAALHGPPPTEQESLKRFIVRHSADGPYRLSTQLSKAVAGWSACAPGADPDEVWPRLTELHKWPESTTSRVRAAYVEYRASRDAELNAWTRRRAAESS